MAKPAATCRAPTDLPTSGYALVVDGHVKREFKTQDSANQAAKDLKKRFPNLCGYNAALFGHAARGRRCQFAAVKRTCVELRQLREMTRTGRRLGGGRNEGGWRPNPEKCHQCGQYRANSHGWAVTRECAVL
jgi:hypothetical protein